MAPEEHARPPEDLEDSSDSSEEPFVRGGPFAPTLKKAPYPPSKYFVFSIAYTLRIVTYWLLPFPWALIGIVCVWGVPLGRIFPVRRILRWCCLCGQEDNETEGYEPPSPTGSCDWAPPQGEPGAFRSQVEWATWPPEPTVSLDGSGDSADSGSDIYEGDIGEAAASSRARRVPGIGSARHWWGKVVHSGGYVVNAGLAVGGARLWGGVARVRDWEVALAAYLVSLGALHAAFAASVRADYLASGGTKVDTLRVETALLRAFSVTEVKEQWKRRSSSYVTFGRCGWLPPLVATLPALLAYYVARWFLSTGGQLLRCDVGVRDAAMCADLYPPASNGVPRAVLDSAGHCCHVENVTFDLASFLAGTGGSFAAGYGSVKLLAELFIWAEFGS